MIPRLFVEDGGVKPRGPRFNAPGSVASTYLIWMGNMSPHLFDINSETT